MFLLSWSMGMFRYHDPLSWSNGMFCYHDQMIEGCVAMVRCHGPMREECVAMVRCHGPMMEECVAMDRCHGPVEGSVLPWSVAMVQWNVLCCHGPLPWSNDGGV